MQIFVLFFVLHCILASILQLQTCGYTSGSGQSPRGAAPLQMSSIVRLDKVGLSGSATDWLIVDSYISVHCQAVQQAGWVCVGAESRLSNCAMGWWVMHQGRVQAVWLYNELVDSCRLYIGAAVR